MAYIKSRKHGIARPATTAVGLALASLAGHAAEPATAPTPGESQTALPAVSVKAAPQRAADYKADTVSSPKFTQPLVDTPQTITVVKKEVLQQQGAKTLTEALRNTPGITLQLGENGNTQSGDAISMRGFDTQSSIYVDGVRDVGTITRDMFNTEQVEVVKGPSGSDNGRGAPTGYVNLSTKVPMAESFANGSVMYGSADQYRITADLNRPLDGPIAGTALRLNVMGQGGGVAGRDWVENRSWGIAPSLAFGLGSATRTYIYYLHMRQDNRPDGGIPTVGLPGYYAAPLSTAGIRARKVDTSNYYGSLSDFDDVTADMLTARFEHDFTPTLKLKNTTRWGYTEQFRSTTSVIGPTFTNLNDPSTWTVARNRADGTNRQSDGGQSKLQTNEIITNQTNVTADFTTGSIQHALSAGVEFIYEKQNRKHLQGASGGTGAANGTFPAANLYNPDPTFALFNYDPRPNGAYDEGKTKTAAVYAFDTLTLNPQWKLTAGLRWEHYTTDFKSRRVAAPAGQGPASYTELDDSDDLLSWKLGLLYKPAENGSIYLAYATSSNPPGGSSFQLSTSNTNANQAVNNPVFDPQEARTVELGTKWDLLDNRLAVTGALYRTEVKNEVYVDSVSNLAVQLGEKRVQGAELALQGQIAPNWSAMAGLAYTETEVTRGANNQVGAVLAFTPKWAFTSWTSYRLPIGLTVAGGARYEGSKVRQISNSTAPSTGISKTDAYWVFDAMAAYELSKNVTLQLNVYNLLDKDYVASVNGSGSRYTPGVPRSFQASANFKF
jgi:catecholate siderophore receptor